MNGRCTHLSSLLLELHLALDVLVVCALLALVQCRGLATIKIFLFAGIKDQQELIVDILFDLRDLIVTHKVEGGLQSFMSVECVAIG
jgi:hypothetical protein